MSAMQTQGMYLTIACDRCGVECDEFYTDAEHEVGDSYNEADSCANCVSNGDRSLATYTIIGIRK